ncbi:MAG: FAD-dependent oxidoreductase, partial [Actinomycetota bacterium]|nr:FAD-dependent oxidoreductase [Actinomycetota bacterium]
GPTGDPSSIPVAELDADFDAIVLAGGATNWRDLPIPGRELDGIHQAMEYLPLATNVQLGDLDQSPITAAGKRVVIIGGGDTGADCLGTAHRQGALSIHQFEIMDRPPDQRSESTPWPTYPLVFRVSSAHEEGGDRWYAVNTTEFVGENGKLTKLRGVKVQGPPSFDPVHDSEFELEVDMVFLAMGFVGPEHDGVVAQLGAQLDARGNVERDANWQVSGPTGPAAAGKVFACGDMGRGQSLIVWAIAEGRSCAAGVDRALMGSTLLPSPVRPTDRPLV